MASPKRARTDSGSMQAALSATARPWADAATDSDDDLSGLDLDALEAAAVARPAAHQPLRTDASEDDCVIVLLEVLCVCARARTHACAPAHVHACVRACSRACVHAFVCGCACAYVQRASLLGRTLAYPPYKYMCIYMYDSTYLCIYASIYLYINTSMYLHIYIQPIRVHRQPEPNVPRRTRGKARSCIARPRLYSYISIHLYIYTSIHLYIYTRISPV